MSVGIQKTSEIVCQWLCVVKLFRSKWENGYLENWQLYLGLYEESTKLYHCFFFLNRDDVEALLCLLPALNFYHIVNYSVGWIWSENMKLVKDGVGFLIKMGHRVFVSVHYRLFLGLARAAFHFFQWDRPFKQTVSKAPVALCSLTPPFVLLAYEEAMEHRGRWQWWWRACGGCRRLGVLFLLPWFQAHRKLSSLKEIPWVRGRAGSVAVHFSVVLNQHLNCRSHLLSFPRELVLWAACQEEVDYSWQGSWVSNYQIPGLIAITWTPRQGELLEKNVISEAGTLLLAPCLGTNPKQSPVSPHLCRSPISARTPA